MHDDKSLSAGTKYEKVILLSCPFEKFLINWQIKYVRSKFTNL